MANQAPNLEPDLEPTPPAIADDNDATEPSPPPAPQPVAQNNSWGSLKERLSQARARLGQKGTPNPTIPNSLAGAAPDGGRETVLRAERRAVKEIAKRAARQASAQEAKVMAAATSEFWVPALVIIGSLLLVVIIFIAIFSFNSFSGQNGGGIGQYPSTDTEREQATLLASLSGNALANNKTVAEVVGDEKERYERIKNNARQFAPDLVSSVEAKITEFTPLLDAIVGTQDRIERLKVRDNVMAKMLDFESTLPFGDWASRIALSHQNEGSLNFCKITKAGAKVACASFASTVLWEAGIPNAIVGTTTAIWSNKAFRTVVDRPASRSTETWAASKDRLRPGDVVWWGDGSCSRVRYAGKLFDHVGIYVGNGEAVDNSSAQEKILKRDAAKRGSCLVFNGAKRYGKD